MLAIGKGGKYKVKIIDTNYIINDVVQLFSRTINRSINIERHLAPDLKMIKVDESQIHQTILNICINARDAMPQGGLLTLETKNIFIDNLTDEQITGISPGQHVYFGIRDTGIGIDEETQNRIFESFFSTKEKKRGTDLGLAMVYWIIKNHDGHVSVQSELGRYTLIEIYLPIVEYDIELGKDDLEDTFIKNYLQPIKKQINGNILLVDDEPVIIKVAEKILKEAGYTVLHTTDGRKAVEIYKVLLKLTWLFLI